MFEEIADSMTTGGMIAAGVGLVASLIVVASRIRDYNLNRHGRNELHGDPDFLPPEPAAAESEAAETPPPTAPDSPTEETVDASETAGVVDSPVAQATATDVIKEPEPVEEKVVRNSEKQASGSVFKPYIPPKKSS